MDLIRLLLLQEESGVAAAGTDAYPENVKAYHAALLLDAGFIDGVSEYAPDGSVGCVFVHRLTWDGHDFLDAARSDTVWNKAKEKVLKPGLSWTFSMLLEFLKAEAHAQMQKHGFP
jgi:hypothetical protein